MTLTEILDKVENIYFANPVNYSDGYFINTICVNRESDISLLKPYFRADGSGKARHAELQREIDSLNAEYSNRFHLNARCFSYVVADSILESAEETHRFFIEKHKTIVGPRCKYDGTYIGREGTAADRLDIFGNPITEAEYKFFGSASTYLDETEYFKRFFSIKYGDEEDFLQVLTKKAAAAIREIYREGYDHPDYDDVTHYFDDGELGTDPNYPTLFVRDLDDEDEIEDAITDWINEYLCEYIDSDLDEDIEIVHVSEDQRGQYVKLKNAISFDVSL